MEKTKINQKEYLKKYLSGGGDSKKKKKKLKIGPKTVKIVDDDLDFTKLRPIEDEEFEIFNDTEDAPQIVGVIDDRGPINFSDKKRWRIIADDGDGDIEVERTQQNEQNVEEKEESSRKEKTLKKDKSKRKENLKDSQGNNEHEGDSSARRETRSKPSKRKSRKESGDSGSDSDLSLPRQSNSETNGKRGKRKRSSSNSGSDLSPPRKPTNERNNKKDKSRKKSKSPDSDLSPPRQSKRGRNDRKDRPRRRSRSRDSNSDLSPPRKSRWERSDKKEKKRSRSREPHLDSSRPRKSRWDKDDKQNKSRRSKSPVHADSSPPRKSRKSENVSRKSSVVQCDEFTISTEASGFGQATIYRDRKTGKKRDMAAESAEEREKKKKQDELDEKYAQWGKGLKQAEDQADKLQRDLHEMNKPLARYADDADLDHELRQQLHDDDPMLAYMKEKLKKSGKIKDDKLTYQGSFMPNRFGIKPGYRWDGVDRSNGYEKKWFDSKSAKVSLEEEAYKWSTADM